MTRWPGLVSSIMGALGLLGGACFLSYRSGCVFDGKQGYGNFALGTSYDSLAAVLLVADVACLVAAAIFSSHRPLPRAILAVLAVLLGAPLGIYLMFEANLYGIAQCKPV